MMERPRAEVVRTSKVKQLKDALRQNRLVYIGGRFGGGKSTLLRQLAASWPGEAAWVPAGALTQLPEPGTTLLLLDDVQDYGVVQMMAARRLLGRLDEGCCAVLCGRAQLPVWLKPMYAADRLTVLDEGFLFFDREEITQFLLEHDLEADEPLTDSIRELTEGWPLLLSLYAVRQRDDPGMSLAVLRTLVQQDVFDCFETLIYGAADEDTRQLLDALTPFDPFTPALAQAVCASSQAAEVLRELVQHCGLASFMPPETYRFAPMFRTYLRHRQQTADPALLQAIHLRAARFFEEQGDVLRAVASYHAAGQTEEMVRLLLAYSDVKPGDGFLLDAQTYYRQVPEETMHIHPELMASRCMLESMLMDADASERWYGALKQFTDATPRKDPRWRVASDLLVYLDIALPHRGSKKMPALLKAAAQLAVYPDHRVHSVSVASNCPSLLNGGKDFCVWLPHGRQLYNMLHRVVGIALGDSGVGLANTALGEALFETSQSVNDPEPLPLLNAGLAEASICGDTEMCFAATGIMARLFLAQGSSEAALSLLTGFRARLPEDASWRLRANLEACITRMNMAIGTSLPVRHWMDADAPNELEQMVTLERYRYMTKVRGYIIRGQWVEGLALLSRMRLLYIRYQRPYGQAEVALLTAVLYRRSRLGDWQEPFREALSICERYGMIRLIADEGIAVCAMLTELIAADTPYHAALLTCTQQQARLYPRYMQPVATGKETLTDSERTVYQLLLSGRKNAEIASVLGITLRTVKFHTANLYRKLNVQTRAQAVKRAAELGEL